MNTVPDDPDERAALLLTPRQERALFLLELVGPGPAAFYRDALRMMSDSSFEASTHLVSHCLREIESAIRDVLLPDGLPQGGESTKAKETHKREVLAILERFELDDAGDGARTWRGIAAGEDPLHMGAHRNALMAPRRLDTAFRERFDKFERLLIEVLTRFEANFVETIRLVDKLAAVVAPTKSHVERLSGAVSNSPVVLHRFFSKAGPAWVPLLRDKGYFAAPADDQARGHTLAAWAYLARVAALADGPTSEAIGEIARMWPATKNPWISRNLAAVALVLPVDDAERLGRCLVSTIGEVKPGFTEELAVVIQRLAREGRTPAAIEILCSLLAVAAGQGEEEGDAPASQPRIDTYEFERFVRKHAVAIVAQCGAPAFAAVCEILERAARLPSLRTGRPDGAARFRSDIAASTPTARSDGAYSLLIDLVRDAAVELGRADAASVPPILKLLEEREPEIFLRLTLHLVGTLPDASSDALRRLMLDATTFESITVWQERRRLEHRGFTHLSEEDKRAFLEIIARGPDLAEYRNLAGVTEGDFAGHVALWKRRHLAALADVLPEAARAEYTAIVDQYGPESGDVFEQDPSDSPRNASELEALTIDELLAFLANWEPVPNVYGPFASREGLGGQIATLVANRPAPFAAAAQRFCEQRPAYVRALVDGLATAAANEMIFDWSGVVGLCAWAAEQSSEDTISWDEATGRGEDPGWRWTHMAVARLLRAGLRGGPSAIPREQDASVLTVLARLASSSEPVSTFADPHDGALNSVRGNATDAIVLWAVRDARGRSNKPRQFAARVADVLHGLVSEHLDPGVRAMLGVRLPDLVAMDPAWVTEHRVALLPDGPDAHANRNALWRTYLTTRHPTGETFRLMSDEYRKDVETLRTTPALLDREHMQALIHHIVELYLNGLIPLGNELLEGIFSSSDLDARTYLLRHVGFSFLHAKSELDDFMRERARELWDARSAALRSVPESQRAKEAAEFGWWFASEAFDLEWSLETLEAVLDASPGLELDHAVADRLAAIAPTMPERALTLLTKMLSNAQEWTVFACKKGLEGAVRAALASALPKAERLARDLVNRLAARGHTDLLELLAPGGPAAKTAEGVPGSPAPA